MKRVEFLEAAYQPLIEFELRKSFHSIGERYAIKTYSGRKENVRGYDLEVCSLIPLFLQIKVADFYQSFSTSKLQTDRKNIGIADNPGCYAFALHPDKKTVRYKQHNLLAALHSSGNYARYVAPIFHTDSALEYYKYNPKLPHWGPTGMSLFDDELLHWRDYVTFDHSMSIIPHKVVTDATSVPHHYTYSAQCEVAFHSEAEPVERSERFLRSIQYELGRAQRSEPKSLSQINDSIEETLSPSDVRNAPATDNSRMDQTSRHLRLARYIKRNFNIDCVLVSHAW
jgi:hypothetical protein